MAWIAEYHFDDVGSGTAVDATGNGHDIDLTAADAEQVTGGQTGGALGKTGAVMPVLPSSLLVASQTDDRTVMFDALTTQTVWWIRWESDALGSGTWGVLSIDGTSMLGQARRQTDGALAVRPAAAPPEVAVWHNYALTYQRSTGLLTMYRDGTQADQTSFAAGTQLHVGADRINLAEWSGTGPRIDNLRVATHAAGGAEVSSLAGAPVSGETTAEGAGAADFTIAPSGVGGRAAAGAGAAGFTVTAAGAGTGTRPGAAAVAFALIDLAMAGDGQKTAAGSAASGFTLVATGAAAATRGASDPLTRTAAAAAAAVTRSGASAAALARTAPSARGA